MSSPARVMGCPSDMHDLVPLAQTNSHADPQAVFSQLRAEWGEVAPVELEPGINAWLVMGHEELATVLRHERLFAKDARHWRDYAEHRVRGDSILRLLMFPRPNAWHSDGPEHRRMRAPIDVAMSGLRPRRMSQLVGEVCSALIGDFAPRGRADLIDDYALMVPTMAIGLMLGLDLGQAREIHDSLPDLSGSGKRSRKGNEARFIEILGGLLWDRRARPADDLATVLVRDEGLLSDEERMHTMTTMIVASAELTMAWVGTSLRLLLTDPRFAARVRGGRLGIDDALNEVLWREPPISSLPARFALRDVELGGQPVRRGDALILGFSAANADPRVHSDDRWNELENRAHLAWGAGPHTCPAQVPARIMTRTAVESVLNQLPGLRPAGLGGGPGWLKSPWTRCPDTLPVTFTPARAGS